MNDGKFMTCVLPMSVRDFGGNPHKVETPFGMPLIIADGNLAAEVDRLQRELDSAARRNGGG